MSNGISAPVTLLVVTLWLSLFAGACENTKPKAPTTRVACPADVLFSRTIRARGNVFALTATVRDGTRILWTRGDGTQVTGACQILEVWKKPSKGSHTRGDVTAVIYRAFEEVDGGVPWKVFAADATVDVDKAVVYLAKARGPNFWITAFDLDAIPVGINGEIRLLEPLPPNATEEQFQAAAKRAADRHYRNVASHIPVGHEDYIARIGIKMTEDMLTVSVCRENQAEPEHHIWSMSSQSWKR